MFLAPGTIYGALSTFLALRTVFYNYPSYLYIGITAKDSR
jgi:hypothetical protein